MTTRDANYPGLLRIEGSAAHVLMVRAPYSREIVDRLREQPALDGYHLLPSVRGDLLMKLGRWEEARAAFERAAEMTRNARERALLLERAAACACGAAPNQGGPDRSQRRGGAREGEES